MVGLRSGQCRVEVEVALHYSKKCKQTRCGVGFSDYNTTQDSSILGQLSLCCCNKEVICVKKTVY